MQNGGFLYFMCGQNLRSCLSAADLPLRFRTVPSGYGSERLPCSLRRQRLLSPFLSCTERPDRCDTVRPLIIRQFPMESMLRTRPESFLQILPDTLPGKERSGSRRRGVLILLRRALFPGSLWSSFEKLHLRKRELERENKRIQEFVQDKLKKSAFPY